MPFIKKVYIFSPNQKTEIEERRRFKINNVSEKFSTCSIVCLSLYVLKKSHKIFQLVNLISLIILFENIFSTSICEIVWIKVSYVVDFEFPNGVRIQNFTFSNSCSIEKWMWYEYTM